jgi:hypothetical protein
MLKAPAFRMPISLSPGSSAWILTFCAVLPLLWLLLGGQFGILAFILAFMTLAVATFVDKQLSICMILTFLFLLGDVRRIVGSLLGFAKHDPLLLVGPLVTIMLALPLLMRLRLTDPITKVMVGLMAIMALEAVNPKQGPITVGLVGAMFYLLPMLWFWIGRKYGTPALLETVIYKVVIPLAVAASLLGIWQTYVGFLPWEQTWIAGVSGHYHALGLGEGLTRSFGFSANSVEYANLLLIGATCALAAFFSGRRIYGFLFPLLGFSLFLASSRTAIVKLLFSIALAWAVSNRGGRGWAVRLPIALAVVFGGLALLLSQASSGGGGSTAASISTQHQVEGLAHPLDEKRSTAGIHAAMLVSGIKSGFTYPIGHGLGSVTNSGGMGDDAGAGAPSSQGDEESVGSTEVDVSDNFVSMGCVGGLLYIYMIFLVIRRAIQFGRTAPGFIGLPALAILAAMGGSWIAQGQYGIGPIVWFVIGVIARNSVPAVRAVGNKRSGVLMAAPRVARPATAHSNLR